LSRRGEIGQKHYENIFIDGAVGGGGVLPISAALYTASTANFNGSGTALKQQIPDDLPAGCPIR